MKKLVIGMTLLASTLSFASTVKYEGVDSTSEKCLVTVELDNESLKKIMVEGKSQNYFIRPGTGQEIMRVSPKPEVLTYYVEHPDQGKHLDKVLNYNDYFSSSKRLKKNSEKYETSFSNLKYLFSGNKLFEEDLSYLQKRYEGSVEIRKNSKSELKSVNISRGKPSFLGKEASIMCSSLKKLNLIL